MKKKLFVFGFVLVLSLSLVCIATAVPLLINYQGKLSDISGPVNGVVSLTFRIYNTPTEGTPLWEETHDEVQLNNGVYNVLLGSGATNPDYGEFDIVLFSQDNCWLEVQVGDETLVPRQRVTSVAFSLRAGDADTLSGYNIDYFDSTYVNTNEENSITSIMIEDGTVTSIDIKDNSITSDDIAEGAVTSEEIMDSSVESKDIKVPLYLSGALESDGIIKGENTSALKGYGLFGLASGTEGYGVVGRTTGSSGRGVYGVAEDMGDNSLNFGGYFHSKGGNGRGIYGQADGSTGIGVRGVATKEEEGIRNYGGFFEARGFRGKGVYGVAKGTGDDNGVNDDPGDPGRPRIGGYFDAYGQYARGVQGHVMGVKGVGGYFISEREEEQTVGGKGTLAVAKGTGGDDENYNVGGYFEARSDYGRGVIGVALGPKGRGVRGLANNNGDVTNIGGTFEARGLTGRGVYGVASHTGGNKDNFNFGGYFEAHSEYGRGLLGYASGSNGIGVRGLADKTGNVTNYGGSFEAYGEEGTGVYGKAPKKGVYGWATGSNGKGIYGIASNTGNVPNIGGLFEARGSQGKGVYGIASKTGNVTNYGGYFKANGQYGIGLYAHGGSSGWAAILRGNVKIQREADGATVMELGEGLDYAEGFDVSDEKGIKPGYVLVIDPRKPGKLTISTVAYDRRVAGIVAGAKNLGSGVRLGVGQFDYDVALAGRVYCYVDASREGIEPGDLLTTSDVPGYAMKAVDHVRAQGAILGKAMERLEKGRKGEILVLVTLQ